MVAAETPAEDELLALLRTKGLSIKNLDEETCTRLRAYLNELHVERGMSLTDIAKMIGNKTSGYTSWLCRQLGVSVRPFEEARLKGIREKRRKYERRPFDGTDEDRAYLLGLRHGDLSVSRPWNRVVRVSTSTTHPAMVELFRSLFERYGHVYQHPRYKKDTNSYEWNLSVILDDSFEFLFQDFAGLRDSHPKKAAVLLAYVAGIIDAEGSIGIYSNKTGTALQLLVYNTNLELVSFVKSAWTEMGFAPVGPYLDKEKGSVTSKYMIERRKDYWKVALARFEQVQSLLSKLPIRHREKIDRKTIALSLHFGELWPRVEPRVRALRKEIQIERDDFIRLAAREYSKTHSR